MKGINPCAPRPPHYTSPADLRDRLNQPRVHTGIEEWNGGAIRGLVFALIFEAIAVAVVLLVALAIGELLK